MENTVVVKTIQGKIGYMQISKKDMIFSFTHVIESGYVFINVDIEELNESLLLATRKS